jgi:hypothetical protein
LWTCTCGFQAAELIVLGYLVSASGAYLKAMDSEHTTRRVALLIETNPKSYFDLAGEF